MKRRTTILSALVIAVGLLFISGVAGSPPGLSAAEFRSTGDEISGWHWLRDDGLQQSAEWVFTELPSGSEVLILSFNVLATDRPSGGSGFSARFRLIYGFPGSGIMGGVFQTKLVTLPNVSSPEDPLGYSCQGAVALSRAAFPAATSLFFKVERISLEDPHVAFNAESIVFSSGQAEFQLMTVPIPSAFIGTGDDISGFSWCRRAGHTLEWTWGPVDEASPIVEGAVNFSLLVTNTFDGGSGYSAVIPVSVCDLQGRTLEDGVVSFTNTFAPQFSGNSAGIGYAASGAYVLISPELIAHGFKLRLSWPVDASFDVRHFAGNEKSALLAYVIWSSERAQQ